MVLTPAPSATATTFEAMVVEDYVYGLAEDRSGWISRETAKRAVGVLRDIRREVRGLPLPNVAPGPEGVVAFYWRDSLHYLSVDVNADGRLEVSRIAFMAHKVQEGAYNDDDAPDTRGQERPIPLR
jgi:hypothetical protein